MPTTYRLLDQEHAALMAALTNTDPNDTNAHLVSQNIWRAACTRLNCRFETIGPPPPGQKTIYFTAEPVSSESASVV